MTRLILALLALFALAGTAAAQAVPARMVQTDDGPLWVTLEGYTLYTSSGDDATPGKSNCTLVVNAQFPDPTSGFGFYKLPGYKFARSCAEVHRPFRAAGDAVPVGDWGLIARNDGARQWTYRGRPLYTSIKDRKPGDINGLQQGQFARRGLRLAFAPTDFPPGIELARNGNALVLVGSDGRPLVTQRSARLVNACLACADDWRPVSAPAIASLKGDWSSSEAGAGKLQYNFRGKPLYQAPEGISTLDILSARDWDTVAYARTASPPSAISVHYSPILGELFTTKTGRTLYTFSCSAPSGGGAPGCDEPGAPAGFWSALCGDGQECSRRWRPYLAAPGAKGSGEWSVVEVADPMFSDPAGTTYPAGGSRVKAWAWRGRPVYTFHQDQAPGDIWGHMVRWFGLSGFVAIEVPGRGITP